MRSQVAVCVAAGVLTACSSVQNNYVPRTEQISFPPLNEVRSATLGEEMLKQGTATTSRGVYLPQENPIKGYVLTPGFYPQIGVDEEYVFTGFETGNANRELGKVRMGGGLLGGGSNLLGAGMSAMGGASQGMGGGSSQAISAGSMPSGIRFSTTEQETCLIVPNTYGMSIPVCDSEYPYEFTERPMVSENNFQQTLIYSGRVGDRIRISYREFAGSVARSAFTNDAEYDLSASDVVAYRGARIRIIQADNESIEYEVLSNFNLAD